MRGSDRGATSHAADGSELGRGSDDENIDPNESRVGAFLDESAPHDSDSDAPAFYNEDEEEEEGDVGGVAGGPFRTGDSSSRPRIPLLESEDDEGEDLYGETMER